MDCLFSCWLSVTPFPTNTPWLLPGLPPGHNWELFQCVSQWPNWPPLSHVRGSVHRTLSDGFPRLAEPDSKGGGRNVKPKASLEVQGFCDNMVKKAGLRRQLNQMITTATS